ncbi:surface-adhesin E family protein [Sphingomonas sp. G-3-2-10]|uniref:surface-adhesin E family protein n=1 Tax=Sphingomonas sp. G-3-2-10 TaxID=2728838 RepID=UPI00146D4919|nr:surface-adhesin E family protein [Sphingomonas sp. G-3-2-10]NML06069.1 hypothetical protein [Sphingomonas sp. G-3-2-10]
MKVMIGAAALFAAPVAMAQASDWRSIGEFGEGDKRSSVFLDVAAVKKPSATMREVTVASHFAVERQFSSGQRYSMIRITYRIDCSANTFQTVYSTAYLGEDSLFSSDTVTPMVAINPATIAGKTAPMACSGNYNAVPRITAATPNLEGRRIYGQ